MTETKCCGNMPEGNFTFDALWAVTIAQDQLLKKRDAAILDYFNPDEAFRIKQEIVQRLLKEGKS